MKRVFVPLTAALLSYVAGVDVHAGECANDWPNPYECFPDVLCPEYAAYWDWRRSIVHLYGPDIGGTGVLINNANCHVNAKDCGVPYLLTANHVVSQKMGQSMSMGQRIDIQTLTSFTFGFEAAVCGGGVGNGVVAIIGAEVVVADPDKDLLLLRLSTTLPKEVGAHFVGWCGGPMNQGVSISHPCGATRRVAVSEFGVIEFAQTLKRFVYDVYWWQDGAVAEGSSGAPLLESGTGLLKGIFTNAVGDGSAACSNPGFAPAHDRFTALTSILEFLPFVVDGGYGCIGHFDGNEGAPLAGTVEDANYYGPGVTHKISAAAEVLLVDGFAAAAGSHITITIEP
jgi:hypothetical protein